MSLVVKTIRREGQKAPKTAEVETPFYLGRRINVEYDLPIGCGAYVGYAGYIDGKIGQAIGVFEVTDICLNMLVNPNFTMIELVSRDEKFDKVHPDSKKMLIEEGVVLKRLKAIDEKMVTEGLEKEIIKLVDSPHGDGVVCSIGDNWFYFGGEEAERSTVKEYKRNIPKDVIVKEICAVLDEFEGEPAFNDEYLYYYSHLCERLKELGAQGSVSRLIDSEKMCGEKGSDGVIDKAMASRQKANKGMNVLIYKIDSSKLIKIGEEGYLPGQEQAKTYFDSLPKNEDFEIKIFSENIKEKIANVLGIGADIKADFLLSVDNKDSQRVSMTVYYLSSKSKAAQHCVVSYANVDEVSNYELANQILEYIEDCFRSRLDNTAGKQQKCVEDVIANASERSNVGSRGVIAKGDGCLVKEC